jgi:hypothetical protein
MPFVSAEIHPWDLLRPVSEAAYSFDHITKFLVFIFSLLLCFIAVKAYFKSKSRRFLLVATAFLLFAAKWLLKTLDLFLSPGSFLPDSSENVFELFILLLLFVALFFKPKNK